jgi:NO-binding membrane sensor protein with MHYT domain
MVWLAGGSLTMGLGIWAMHYIRMLAWTLPVAVLYDWPTVVGSLFAAILASGVALFIASRPRRGGEAFRSRLWSLDSASRACTISARSHAAAREVPLFFWNRGLIDAFAIAISTIALRLIFECRDDEVTGRRKLGSAVLIGAAISGLHYTGMAAVTLVPMEMGESLTHAVAISSPGVVVISSITFLILGLGLLTSLINRRFVAPAMKRVAMR